jgi:hypothetical protein
MKNLKKLLFAFAFMTLLMASDCADDVSSNTSAIDEQHHTEKNQRNLNQIQPAPRNDWSLERDNLIKRSKLQNDRSVMFFMYIFVEGVSQPIGFYQVNKVSSVDSQLTNTMQIISSMDNGNNLPNQTAIAIPSPSEDGSYGTNGSGVFGFTPEEIYIETNMHYVTSSVPLHFQQPVNRLAIISDESAQKILDISKKAMAK